MMMVLEPVEVFSSTPRGAEKVKVEIDNGTELGSLSGSIEGSHDVISYGLFLGDSLKVQTRSM